MPYEASYEYDDGYTGTVLAFNLHGHGLDLDDIELFLESMRDDDLDLDAAGCWEIREDWLRKVPSRDHNGMAHIYGPPGRGARAVTVVEHHSSWGYWCVNHPAEPAQTGHPAENIVDGEQIVTRRLAELANDIDPRPDVDNRGTWAFIYMCRDCSADFTARQKAATRAALEAARKATP